MAQHSIIENIHRNTEDWFAVKAAVRGKGVDCPDNTPTANVAGKIEEIEVGYSNNTIGNLIWGEYLKSGGDYPVFKIPYDSEHIGQCIGQYKFAGQSLIEEIVIPNFIFAILNNAFQECVNLTKVTLIAGNGIELVVHQFAFDTQNRTFDKLVLLCEGDGSITLDGMSMCCDGEKAIDKLVIGSDDIAFSKFTFNINATTPSSIIPPNISDIYYHGTEEEWNVYVNRNRTVPSEIRSGFTNATMHYNYTGDGSEL